jgi:hypothetical protein
MEEFMELNDTIEMMNSPDYKERFKAEYLQLKIRYTKLYNMLIKYKAGVLGFSPRCSYDILLEQLRAMGQYIMLLEARAKIEGIEL